MWDDKKDPEVAQQKKFGKPIIDGKHNAEVVMFKHSHVDALNCDKITLGLRVPGYAPIYKDYPECFDWAFDAFCQDMAAAMPGVSPSLLANSGAERQKLIGKVLDITVKLNRAKLDNKGNPRVNVFVNGVVESVDAPPSGNDEEIELDDDDPF